MAIVNASATRTVLLHDTDVGLHEIWGYETSDDMTQDDFPFIVSKDWQITTPIVLQNQTQLDQTRQERVDVDVGLDRRRRRRSRAPSPSRRPQGNSAPVKALEDVKAPRKWKGVKPTRKWKRRFRAQTPSIAPPLPWRSTTLRRTSRHSSRRNSTRSTTPPGIAS